MLAEEPKEVADDALSNIRKAACEEALDDPEGVPFTQKGGCSGHESLYTGASSVASFN